MIPQVTVTQKPVSPGRARHSLLKPSRRECRCFGFICGDYLCAFYHCTQGCGCSQTPGIPCALCFSGGTSMHNSDKSCRGNAAACFHVIARSEATKQSRTSVVRFWIASLR